MIEVAKTKGSGGDSYQGPNPVTKKVQTKKSSVKMVEGRDLFFLSGIFQ